MATIPTATRKFIHTSMKPQAPYSSGVQIDHTLYISGQVGLDPKTGDVVPGGIVAETKQALDNMGEILKVAGGNYDSVVKTTVLLADLKEFEVMNNTYKKYFKEGQFPARMAYQVAALPKGARVEIEAVAVIGKVHDISSESKL